MILGGADERPQGEAIAAGMRAPVRMLCGKTTLPELIGVISRLRLLLTNDSGPMHVAAALGVPVVAVFGPTDWRETAPVGRQHRIVRIHVCTLHQRLIHPGPRNHLWPGRQRLRR